MGSSFLKYVARGLKYIITDLSLSIDSVMVYSRPRATDDRHKKEGPHS